MRLPAKVSAILDEMLPQQKAAFHQDVHLEHALARAVDICKELRGDEVPMTRNDVNRWTRNCVEMVGMILRDDMDACKVKPEELIAVQFSLVPHPVDMARSVLEYYQERHPG